jgi:hypothetical protein
MSPADERRWKARRDTKSKTDRYKYKRDSECRKSAKSALKICADLRAIFLENLLMKGIFPADERRWKARKSGFTQKDNSVSVI